ncbi:uncharacterized protein SAMN04488540_103242 [Ferrimonas sediminum]|uniref:Large ribosomal RNA subunit accumulation protein YceD n=1 Tax=Ferrimonas sediminum TaxID=718193 RepID=A0A1G8NUT6_9GAMM|nr:23S rRNA accumulation protein YceD [Ferrimonas sediminum]SDI83974.1 uncharacterized protein SAMN04488540_103242 [Ferrimonas sediminum]
MQNVQIPVSLDPKRAAQRGLSYEGILQAKHLKRLIGVSSGDCTDAEVSVECGTDIQGIVYLKGKAVTELTLTCQRCMETFQHPIAVEFAYSPVTDDSQVEELPDAYDPVELNEHGEIRLQELVEDELLLAVPMMPMHDLADCNRPETEIVVGELPPVSPEEERPNPFAVLQNLKSK